jgi:hypothetical protein
MNPFEMVVIIVVVGCIAGVVNNAIKASAEKRESRKTAGASAEADQLRDQIVTLEERIRVLERIITDSNGRDDLRRQFRDLER